ncbi:Protein kinase, catalytic domain-containing protein [Artemisia annua]|uniref:Protein kinase, catalytic domain-containing protein n=1 Tax=Artemisia annua TaxID=35608 RepID=A0A2U1LBZ0_ARTAN|nr:Protein kinase, catalytic domain-containing protein [Artemisia annua]
MTGANLADCLRNKRNPEFTVLSTWMSRMQIITDLASGLDYIHNNAGLKVNLVHKYVKSSSVIVTEPSFNAKICHFGTAELCGETGVDDVGVEDDVEVKKLVRSDSRTKRFEGVNGYMSPEFCGLATQKSDVYAFGVVRKVLRPIQDAELREKLSVIYKSHHINVVKLLGATIAGGYIYLAYDYMTGANLADCLRNKRNPEFTVLSTWMSRMQIITDLASGLDYIHNNAGLKVNLVHKYVKSSSVIVTEPSFNAKICHFGTAELCGETVVDDVGVEDIVEVKKLVRSDSRTKRFEGVNGYMSPEFCGLATQKSDVYAFGVVVLEVLTGEEPVKYKYDKATGNHMKILVVETARLALESGNDGGTDVEGRLRRWVDRRLKDSFPVVVVEKLTRIALDCVEYDPSKRPNMSRVAGKVSKLYLDSRKWADTIRVPNDFTASFAPR